jgi:hypothetical protein
VHPGDLTVFRDVRSGHLLGRAVLDDVVVLDLDHGCDNPLSVLEPHWRDADLSADEAAAGGAKISPLPVLARPRGQLGAERAEWKKKEMNDK